MNESLVVRTVSLVEAGQWCADSGNADCCSACVCRVFPLLCSARRTRGGVYDTIIWSTACTTITTVLHNGSWQLKYNILHITGVWFQVFRGSLCASWPFIFSTSSGFTYAGPLQCSSGSCSYEPACMAPLRSKFVSVSVQLMTTRSARSRPTTPIIVNRHDKQME